jgi:hypothetical protein
VTLARRSILWTLTIAIAVGVLLFVWHRHEANSQRQQSTVTGIASENAEGHVSSMANETSPTQLYAHNIMLRKGAQFRVYIRWIRGQLMRTHRDVNPSLDDTESFTLVIEKGVIRANIGDIGNYLNAASPTNAPLKDIKIEPDGELLKLHGTVHKIFALPVELTGQLSPATGDRLKFHVTKLTVLKIPLKGLLRSLHVELSDLVPSADVPGVQVSGNDIFFDTEHLLPPPHIRGQITSVQVKTPDLEVVYGNAENDESRLSQWHNFLKLTGGSLDFGKLTMRNVDLTMIDASQDPWFDLDLVNYQAQLVNGYSRMTPQAGLEIFMPDAEKQSPKSPNQAITLEWLKNRKQSLPSTIPVK